MKIVFILITVLTAQIACADVTNPAKLLRETNAPTPTHRVTPTTETNLLGRAEQLLWTLRSLTNNLERTLIEPLKRLERLLESTEKRMRMLKVATNLILMHYEVSKNTIELIVVNPIIAPSDGHKTVLRATSFNFLYPEEWNVIETTLNSSSTTPGAPRTYEVKYEIGGTSQCWELNLSDPFAGMSRTHRDEASRALKDFTDAPLERIAFEPSHDLPTWIPVFRDETEKK